MPPAEPGVTLASGTGGDGSQAQLTTPTTTAEGLSVERSGEYAASATWRVPGFSSLKAKQLWSESFSVAGYSLRLLLYPRGDSQALPGYLSLYLQVSDAGKPVQPGGRAWDCFASYRLAVCNAGEPDKPFARDSWHRFSGKKRSHGWCDFTATGPLLDARSLCLRDDTLELRADVLLLHESCTFEPLDGGSVEGGAEGEGSQSGRFTWKCVLARRACGGCLPVSPLPHPPSLSAECTTSASSPR